MSFDPPTAGRADVLPRFLEAASRLGMWSTPRRLATYGSALYADIPLAGKRVLDIGGGTGVFSLYAAALGAERVVCLEPGAAGSEVGMRETFRRVADDIGVPNVEMLPSVVQDFSAEPGSFDVILLHNSINHFDEPACIALRRDPQAEAVYRQVFETISEWMAQNGHLLLADCTSSNLFPALGVRNPFAPTIEWHKHQPPETWERLLAGLGYRRCCLHWTAPSMLGNAGRVLLANRLGAYLTLGHFRLHMRKVGTGNGDVS